MTIDNITAKLDNMNINNCVNTKSDNMNNDCTITETDDMQINGVKTKNLSPNMIEK